MSNFELELFNSLFSKLELVENKFDSPGVGYDNKNFKTNFEYKLIEIENIFVPFIVQGNKEKIEKFNFNFSSQIQRLIETKFNIKPETIYSKYLKIYNGWNNIN